MKQVVLIGDSIRMGYQEAVREELAAEVWAPEENGGNSRNVLAHLDAWAVSRQPDVVHVNCGLHDLRVEFNSEARAVPLPEYRENVETILWRLQAETGAQVIWAATTPVNEAWHHARKGFDRFEADVVAYNREAGTVCTELGVPVNDLYEAVLRAGRDDLLTQDGVHFGQAGCVFLGRTVADFIRNFL